MLLTEFGRLPGSGIHQIRLFRRDVLQVNSSRCPCNRSVRSFGLTGRLMTFTRPGKDRIDKTKKKIEVVNQKIWLESKRNTPFLVAAENLRQQRPSVKVVLFFRMEYSKQKFEYHSWNPSLIPVPGFRDRFSVKEMVNTIPERNLPVLDFAHHSPKPWADRFFHAMVYDVFHKQNVLNERGSDKSDLTKLRRRRQQERQKSNRFNEQNSNSAHASRFFVHFFAVPA